MTRNVEGSGGIVTRTLARHGWSGVTDPYDRRRTVYYRYRLPGARHNGAVRHVGVNEWKASVQRFGYLSEFLGIFPTRTQAMKAVETAYHEIVRKDHP